jgi:glycogen debranching enzyme
MERLRSSELSTGWGIRTLAQGTISYNPMSYHNGTIWPHDNSLIAAGCFRYRDAAAGLTIGQALLDAAGSDRLHRLPELYCGFAREGYEAEAPVSYPVSCSPQAWAAGALPLVLRGMLGLEIDLERRELIVDPAFPEWLSSVSIAWMEVLGQRGHLLVERTDEGYEVSANGLPLAAMD